ncbi:gp53-like domain-containing protein [Yersinia sp. KBS0713]|uniref:gp53-like domain-containing protein n=1 Tax=Yersinia sp. KBS0713 TaxID=1179669 RepID=UPI0039657A84
MKLPGGLMIQWGFFSGNGTSTPAVISFPSPFPSAAISIVASCRNTETQAVALVSIINNATFKGAFRSPSPTTDTGYFIAIGR